MNNPFFYFKVWRGGTGKLVGQVLSFAEYTTEMNQRPTLHSFTGRTATIAIISDAVTVTRKEKLDFAIKFMQGEMVNVAVDLDRCTSTVTAIAPPPCY